MDIQTGHNSNQEPEAKEGRHWPFTFKGLPSVPPTKSPSPSTRKAQTLPLTATPAPKRDAASAGAPLQPTCALARKKRAAQAKTSRYSTEVDGSELQPLGNEAEPVGGSETMVRCSSSLLKPNTNCKIQTVAPARPLSRRTLFTSGVLDTFSAEAGVGGRNNI